MKLNRIYSNKPDIFSPVKFEEGFNVIFARIKDYKVKERDSHNLGKTFLISIIDFCLLATVDKEHPFKVNQGLFGDFIFFLEIKTNKGQYITVCRKVTGKQVVNIYAGEESKENLSELEDKEWTYSLLSLDKAKEILNELLGIDVIKPYKYRKGLGYFLRTQRDYNDEFQIYRFSKGKEKDWKPYITLILGLNSELLRKKYEVEEDIKEARGLHKVLEKQAGTKSEQYDEIKGQMEILQDKVKGLKIELDSFSFKELEADINENVVYNVESRISELNEMRYVVDYEIQEIMKSLESKFDFDIEKTKRIFEEVKLTLPDFLLQEYDHLIEFNRRLSTGRIERLNELKEKKLEEKDKINSELSELNKERQNMLAILREKKTFEKYKELQKHIIKYEEEVMELREKLSHLDKAETVKREIENLSQSNTEIINKIKDSVQVSSEIYETIRKTLSNYVEKVLSVPAVLSCPINRNHNIDFSIKTFDRVLPGRETSEALGTSYKKILCACFDMAILSVYASQPFYHFVYHDGIFEGLDNRKKVSLLNLIRSLCETKNIQYILTVIDTDLPRDERDEKLLFTKEEIIKELHDEGEDGRLFKMKAF